MSENSQFEVHAREAQSSFRPNMVHAQAWYGHNALHELLARNPAKKFVVWFVTKFDFSKHCHTVEATDYRLLEGVRLERNTFTGIDVFENLEKNAKSMQKHENKLNIL